MYAETFFQQDEKTLSSASSVPSSSSMSSPSPWRSKNHAISIAITVFEFRFHRLPGLGFRLVSTRLGRRRIRRCSLPG